MKTPGTGEFPAQMASNPENVSIWWRHHVKMVLKTSGIQFHGQIVRKETDITFITARAQPFLPNVLTHNAP